MELDEADRKILFELTYDARQSYKDIAVRIGRSKQFVHYRAERLKETGVITGYETNFNIRAFDYTVFNVFLQFSGLADKHEQELTEYLKNADAVGFFFRTLGNWDVFLAVKAQSAEEFYSFIGQLHTRYREYFKEEVINMEVRAENHYLRFLSEHRPAVRSESVTCAIEMSERQEQELQILLDEPLLSTYALSKRFEESYNTIKKDIKQLRESGLLRSARAIIDNRKIGYERYLFLIDVLISDKNLSMIREYVRMHPYIAFSIESVGRWNIVLNVYISDILQVKDICSDLRGRLGDALRSVEFLRIFSSEKENFKLF